MANFKCLTGFEPIITKPAFNDIDDIISLNRRHLYDTGDGGKNSYVRIAYTRSELQLIVESKEIVIVKIGEKVIAYYLIGRNSHNPALAYQRNKAISLFDTHQIQYREVGYGCQVCIEEQYRNNGLFSQMLVALKKLVENKYSCLLCSVSVDNVVSLNTHINNGWQVMNSFETTKYLIFNTNK